jgi:transposase
LILLQARLVDAQVSLPEEIKEMGTVLGIDVSKGSLDVVLRANGRKPHKIFANSLAGFECLAEWLRIQKAGQVHVCLEATGQYGEGVAEYLFNQGQAVSVVNPTRIKKYGESKLHRNKTDKADAELIAEFCAKENPALWTPLPEHIRQLRSLVRRLEDLESMRQQERNRLGSGEKNLQVLGGIQAHIDYLDQQIKSLKHSIQAFLEQYPDLKRQQDLLISIPGIGKLTATRLISEIGRINDFENASQLAAFAGLNPKLKKSGTSIYKKPRLSKEGRTFFRKILFMPAIVAQNHNPIICTFRDRLKQNGLSAMQIIGAVMRKLLHLVFGILRSGKPFDPNFLQRGQVTS